MCVDFTIFIMCIDFLPFGMLIYQERCNVSNLLRSNKAPIGDYVVATIDTYRICLEQST